MEVKLRSFFQRVTADGPQFDTYLIYYSGHVYDNGDWALAGKTKMFFEVAFEVVLLYILKVFSKVQEEPWSFRYSYPMKEKSIFRYQWYVRRNWTNKCGSISVMLNIKCFCQLKYSIFLVTRGRSAFFKNLLSLSMRYHDDFIVGIFWAATLICLYCCLVGNMITLFRGEITPLSSSYNISVLVPVCWLLFQCF